MKSLVITASATFFLLLGALNADCAFVSGIILGPAGKGVGSIKISAFDPKTGSVIGQAVADASGKYKISGLSPGTYKFSLDPGTTGMKGGSATDSVPEHGLIVNWNVSPDEDAIDTAAPAGAGVTAAVGTGLGGAIVSGGILGGLAGAGAFDNGPGPTQSPSF
jgi:hypothetical protein